MNVIDFIKTVKGRVIGKRSFPYPVNKGYCLLCEKDVLFYEEKPWLRDGYKCMDCFSIPRNRALIRGLNLFAPDWRNLQIHESSPGGVLSQFLQKSCAGYSASHYFDDIPRGQYKGEFRSEDISEMTFANEAFDIFITSDVFEHVLNPQQAFSEIQRVLKPSGLHIFTMPWYPKLPHSVPRVKSENGSIVYLEEAVYHGNPINEEGSLVTFDWGRDFNDIIYQSSKMTTTIYLERNRSLGLDGEFLEVFISLKR